MMQSTSKSASADVSLLQIGAMKLGKPLNPYAASFVPPSRQGTADEYKVAAIKIASRDCKNENKTTQHKQVADSENKATIITSGDDSKSHEETAHAQLTNVEEPPNPKDSSQKGPNIHGSEIPHNPSVGAEKHTLVEDFEMELAYLGTQFPGLSEQSLADVYFANDGDLDASIDMLNQLELLDNSDVSHGLGFSSLGDASASMRLKATGSGEASGSSGPSVLAMGVNQQ
ncbi:polyadenylate-binding protein-interacting protein 6-like isoform X2 [Magnolia sinica]|uniref:polyadenylate-binding protein-interacting protein 6-like isoform X2 n=1 Tax=Magnolia sinica TaxID=86752 RepID=UPI00265A0FD3|nr:polyadenylate-binding protein-interacting protein 6-like isoform X2 [Magnolia sinica]